MHFVCYLFLAMRSGNSSHTIQNHITDAIKDNCFIYDTASILPIFFEPIAIGIFFVLTPIIVNAVMCTASPLAFPSFQL